MSGAPVSPDSDTLPMYEDLPGIVPLPAPVPPNFTQPSNPECEKPKFPPEIHDFSMPPQNPSFHPDISSQGGSQEVAAQFPNQIPQNGDPYPQYTQPFPHNPNSMPYGPQQSSQVVVMGPIDRSVSLQRVQYDNLYRQTLGRVCCWMCPFGCFAWYLMKKGNKYATRNDFARGIHYMKGASRFASISHMFWGVSLLLIFYRFVSIII